MARSLSDIALRDEAKEVWPDARPRSGITGGDSLESIEDFFGPRTTQMVADCSLQ